jgi:pimeloyl-ACP methyl ester carboxylesterase
MKPRGIVSMTQILQDIDYPAQGDSLLLLVGEKETIVARRMARRYRDTIPGITVRSVPGVGHAWSLEQPALFAETVRAWVTLSPLPGALRALP